MTLRPIGRSSGSLSDEAYVRISEAMLSGALPPGARLVMDALAEQLDISRTPVRDALLRLQREGLIEPTGRRGYVVREASGADTLHLYEARSAVEVFAARRVAELGKPAIDVVRAAVAEAEQVDGANPQASYRANLLVHRSVVEATGNPVLVELFDNIWTQAKALSTFASYHAKRGEHVPVRKAHEPMLRAFRRGPDAAAEVMAAHITEGLPGAGH
jgi:DNA-binding GntR family transcriptional regulator